MDDQPNSAQDILARGPKAVAGWLQKNWLKFSPLKIEILCLSLEGKKVGGQSPNPWQVNLDANAVVVRSLGAILDASRFMEARVTFAARPTILGWFGN